MSYIALARKYRPRNFAEMTGQEHVLRALGNALDSNRLHHAFLFAGTRGVGKTTVARILAKCLNCERGLTATPCGDCASCREIDAGRSVDLIEVDAASRTKVDDTRELLDNVQYAPTRSRYKIYLIDEVHMLSTHSFNALLKTLEEPPAHVKFLLATTDPQKLPVTVLSRCLQFNLKRLSVALIARRLAEVVQAEGIEFEAPALQQLAQAGDGSLRDALSLLDQLLAFGGGRASASDARAMLGTVDQEHVLRLAQLLATRSATELLEFAAEIEQWSVDYPGLLQQLALLLEAVALYQVLPAAETGSEFPAATVQALAGKMSPGEVQLYYQTALHAQRDLPLAATPQSGLRMALIRMLAFGLDEPESRPAPAAGSPTQRDTVEPPAASAGASAPSAPQNSLGSSAGAPPVSLEDWQAVVASLELIGATRQLAANCALIERQGNVVRLALDARHATMRTRAQEDKLTQALARYLGVPVQLRFESHSAVAQAPARLAERATQERADGVRAAFESDATVQALQQRFGASVHPESLRAVEAAQEQK